MATQRNLNFEGWRVIFILFMVLHHLDSFYDIDIPSFTENIKNFCYEGFVGVNFFFMLSGLGCVLGYKRKLENREISAGGFLLNRLAHLYPAYLLFLITSVFLYAGGHIADIKQILMHIFMLQTFPITSNQAFGYNGVAWCVSATMFFYLIFTVIYRISLKECLLYIVLLSIFILTNMIYHDDNSHVMTALFYTNPVFRLLDFLIGMALGLYFLDHKPICSSTLQILSIVLFVVFLTIGAYGDIAWLYKWGVFYLFPCALLLYSFQGQTSLSKKMFEHRFWQKLASASMIIFLSHQQILNAVKRYASPDFYNYFMPWGVTLCMLLIIIFSVIINQIYAKPAYAGIIKLKEKYMHKSKTDVNIKQLGDKNG